MRGNGEPLNERWESIEREEGAGLLNERRWESIEREEGETIEQEQMGIYGTRGGGKLLNKSRWETIELEEMGIY